MLTHDETAFHAVLLTLAFDGPEGVFIVKLVDLGVHSLDRTEPLIGLALRAVETSVESAVLTVVVVIGLIDYSAAHVLYGGTGIARQVGCAGRQIRQLVRGICWSDHWSLVVE